MGCTSSTTNMPPSFASSDKEHSLSEEGEEHEMEERNMSHSKRVESNGIKVLPTCDTVDGPGQVDRHSKSHSSSSPDLERDSNETGHVTESENVRNPDMNADDLQEEEKLSSLEEVVEKVVELYENGELEIKPNETEETAAEKMHSKPKEHIDGAQDGHDGGNEDVKEDEESEEPVSPSQSQSSRATRWEALADIAAELPPSLAVDPVTGQIYALSKH